MKPISDKLTNYEHLSVLKTSNAAYQQTTRYKPKNISLGWYLFVYDNSVGYQTLLSGKKVLILGMLLNKCPWRG